jgi:hypothetical protein
MFIRTPGGTVKKIALALMIALAAAGAASAQSSSKKATSKAAEHTAAPKPTSMKAEVVSTDAAAKTITVKDSTGASKTLTATGGAVASLAKVKAGDYVMVTGTDTTATKISVVKDTSKTSHKK